MPKIEKSDADWRAQLSDEQYRVLRQEGTERAFTSPLNDEKRDGMFRCAGCGKELFSTAKQRSQHQEESAFVRGFR